MKTRSTIGIILQVVAALAILSSGFTIAEAINQNDWPKTIELVSELVVTVILLLGAAELLHAVMRTAAATEEMATIARDQAMRSAMVSTRSEVASAPKGAPSERSYGFGRKPDDPPTVRDDATGFSPPREARCPKCAAFFLLPRSFSPILPCPVCDEPIEWPGCGAVAELPGNGDERFLETTSNLKIFQKR